MRKMVSGSIGRPASLSAKPYDDRCATFPRLLPIARPPPGPAGHPRPARKPAVIDVALEVGVDPGKSLLVKPDLARVDVDTEVRHGPDPCALHMSLSGEALSG